MFHVNNKRMLAILTRKNLKLAILFTLFGYFFLATTQAQNQALYGVISNELVTINTTTAAVTTVGPYSNALTPLGNITYHAGTGQLLGLATFTSSPTLVSLNTGTGAATVIAPITLAPTGAPAGLMEGLSYNPLDGLLYSSLDTLSPPTSFTSSMLVTVNPTTGVATRVANINGTCQSEADAMTWANGALYTIDGCPNPNIFYNLNGSTGFASQIGVTGVAGIGDMAYDATLNLVYGYNSARQLFTINTSNAALSVIGSTHTAADFGGERFRGLAFVPGTVMPMGFHHLDGWPESQANQLRWELGEEVAYTALVIERSGDGLAFAEIARLTDVQRKREYGYSDRAAEALAMNRAFYRVRLVQGDGATIHSGVVEVTRAANADAWIAIGPNPVPSGRNLEAKFISSSRQVAELEVSDVRGRIVWAETMHLDNGRNQFSVAASELESGIYLLRMRTKEKKLVRKFVVE